MIDNYVQAMALVERMTTSVPIPARPTWQLVDLRAARVCRWAPTPGWRSRRCSMAVTRAGSCAM